MSWLTFAFDQPIYLLLLAIVPLIWWMSRNSLAQMGRVRRALALGLRSLVAVLLVLALADVQLVQITDRIATYFLLDQSASIAVEQRAAALDYVRAALDHRRENAGDLAGVVVFGSEAQIESPLYAGEALQQRIESHVDSERTNLASALRLASATFPDGVGKRVVIVSDGNENTGNALHEAQSLARAGVGIDVAPLSFQAQADVLVEKVTAPAAARSGVPFDVMVVLQNVTPEHELGISVAGRLRVVRKTGDEEQIVAEQAIVVPPGKQVLSFRQELARTAFYRYEARFVADDPRHDRITQNNQATAFTHLQGQGRVLFIVNAEAPHEYDHLIERLRATDIDVTVQSTDALFTQLAELQPYDSVVLANVPQTSGQTVDALTQFSPEQVDLLVKNVEQLGAGLVMLGGPDSFGAGGWANTKLEAAMPVDFQVKNAQVQAVGALMLVIDRSGSMQGEKLEMSKAAAKAAVQMLGPYDQIGVITFDSAATEDIKLARVGENRQRINGRIGRIVSGGGTDMEPAMRRGYEVLRRSQASIKHMIVLTDGQTNGSGFAQMAANMQKQGVTTTSVAVGTDAAKGLLQDIAIKGHGKYYQVMNPKAIPRIFARETRRVVRPLIFESSSGIQPHIVEHHEVLQGVGATLPPITGLVLTTAKDNPLVETPIISPQPDQNPLLATWTYGLGRTAVLTTDGGQRWAKSWPEWEQYDRLFVQLMRWSMRPLADTGSYQVFADVADGRLRVVVNAFDADGDFLNRLAMQGQLVGETDSARALEFRQAAPGRYTAEIDLTDAGSYMLAIQPGPDQGVLRVGVNVPYSAEFQDATTNEALLIGLSQLTPAGGKPGEIIRLPDEPASWATWRGPDVFRRDVPPGRLLSSLWPFVVFAAACLFFFDVFNRRVLVTRSDLAWLLPGQQSPAVEPQRLRASTAARPLPLSPTPGLSDPAEAPPGIAAAPAREHAVEAPPTEAESYAQRLLQVKRDLRRKQAGQEP